MTDNITDQKTGESFSQLMNEFKRHFTGPSSQLIKYLIDQKIMTATDIAKEMGISRQNLYEKYINS